MKAFIDLAVDTLRDPQTTAQRIMAWDLDSRLVYMALFAVAAINAIVTSAPVVLVPGSVDDAARQAMPILTLMERPFVLFALVAGGLVVMVQALYWAGRAMGGQGRLADMLVLLVWLQGLRAAAQVVVFVLSLAVPMLAGLFALVVIVVAFWLLLHFISAAHHFGSLFQAFGLFASVVAGLFLGLMLILTLMGVSAGGL